MHLFYCQNVEKDRFLNEEESHHCVKVLRCAIGDAIQVMDGKGNLFNCAIEIANHRRVAVRIKKKIESAKPKYNLTIAIAPTKNIDRLEWFLEKATEIGISRIIPILCDNSERKIIKNERLEKVLVSAMKQSMQTYMPVLEELTTVSELLARYASVPNSSVNTSTQKFIAHCHNMPKVALKTACATDKDVLILIGPEGDFSEKEVEKAILAGFKTISLGQSRLRTETAGIVACHTVNLVNEKV